jgi:hypothetical protein
LGACSLRFDKLAGHIETSHRCVNWILGSVSGCTARDSSDTVGCRWRTNGQGRHDSAGACCELARNFTKRPFVVNRHVVPEGHINRRGRGVNPEIQIAAKVVTASLDRFAKELTPLSRGLHQVFNFASPIRPTFGE